MSNDAVRLTARHWDSEEPWQIGRGRYWLELPAVQRRLNEKVSGRPEIDWVQYTLEHHLAGWLPLPHCLSLGCGTGQLERRLSAAGAFVICDALDIAPNSIARAAQQAQAAGYNVRYAVQDLNQVQLPVGHYDAIWSAGATHHFERLEHVFAQVAAALKPGGLFVLNEYVGPSRFQFGPRQQGIIQACFDLLPAACRQLTPEALGQGRPLNRGVGWVIRRVWDRLLDGDLLETVWRRAQRAWSRRVGGQVLKTTINLPTVRSVQAVDPSEAVRSAEILPLLQHHFSIVEIKPLGGSILQFLLADIADNFMDERGQRLLDMLFTIEDTLMTNGELPSDFVYVVAAPQTRTKTA